MRNLSAILKFLLRDYLLKAVGDEDDGDVIEDGDGPDDEDESDADETGDDQGDQDPDDEGDEDDPDAEGGDADEDEDADSGLRVSLGDEEPEARDERRAPEWLKELRKSNRDKDRRIRELESKLSTGSQQTQPAAVTVPKEPDPDDYELWDESGKAKFKADMQAYNKAKLDAERIETERKQREDAERAAWQRTTDAYTAAKNKLDLDGFEDAEANVEDAFNPTQRGIVLHALEPKRAALLTFALGNSPKKLKELSSITDPVKFTYELAKLESTLKVEKTKSAPAPERVVRGSKAGTSAVDKPIEGARKSARESGDYSKVMELRRQQRQKEQQNSKRRA
jgi:hypothetical protein